MRREVWIARQRALLIRRVASQGACTYRAMAGLIWDLAVIPARHAQRLFLGRKVPFKTTKSLAMSGTRRSSFITHFGTSSRVARSSFRHCKMWPAPVSTAVGQAPKRS